MEVSKTADSALALLLAVGEHGGASATELSRALGLNRTVTYRLLTTLHERGFLRRDGDIYLLGAILAKLGEQVAPSLRAVARPIMDRLRDSLGETVVLSVRDNRQAVVVAQSPATRHLVRVEHSIGSRHRLHLAASGRALLAFQPAAVIDRCLRDVEDAERYRGLLDQVRSRGYATSHDELRLGVHGLAAPVLDGEGRASAALGVIAPMQRADRLHDAVDAVVRAATAAAKPLVVPAGHLPALDQSER